MRDTDVTPKVESGESEESENRALGSREEQTRKRARGTGAILSRSNSPYLWLQYYRNGKPYRESAHTTDRRKAERMLNRRLAQVASGQFVEPKHERITVAELYKALLADYRVNERASLEGAEQRWNKRLERFFGHLQARAVTTDKLNEYVLACKNGKSADGQASSTKKTSSAKLENATINRDLAALKRAFNLAYRSTPRKVHQVPVFPHLDENPPRRGFVEQPRYDELAKNASKELWLRAFLAVAYAFGFRKSELLNMRVRQIDLLNRTIMLDPGTTKNDDAREVTMTQEVFDLLTACVHGKGPEDFVFTRRNGKPVRDFRESWEKLCVAVGVPGLLLHDLRRSAVRNMVRRGVPERVAMAISGHKTRTVFERYNIVSPSDLREAARKIEQGKKDASAGMAPAQADALSTLQPN